jgi:hypothetical protein
VGNFCPPGSSRPEPVRIRIHNTCYNVIMTWRESNFEMIALCMNWILLFPERMRWFSLSTCVQSLQFFVQILRFLPSLKPYTLWTTQHCNVWLWVNVNQSPFDAFWSLKKSLTIITFNVPVVLAWDVMVLIRENPFQGPLEGASPKNVDFFGPWNGKECSECHLAQKSMKCIYFASPPPPAVPSLFVQNNLEINSDM